MIDQLKRARCDAGFSLEDIAARTKIPVATLAALEEGVAAERLSPFYFRAFLRNYARELKLNPEEILREHAPTYAPLPTAISEPYPSPPPEAARASGRSWLVIAGALMALASIAIFRNDTPPQTAREAGAVATAGHTAASSIPASPPAIESLKLKIRTAGLLWLEVSADGEPVIFQLLQPGQEREVEARNELNILVGDASALEYWINGQPGRSLGGPSQKRRIVVTRDNYRELQQPKPAR